jgi:WD40 repeat protein
MFSPDGTLLATVGFDRTARLWRLPGGTARAVLTGHTGAVGGCAFSPDGRLLATISDDRTARLWRVADGTVAAVLTGHASWVKQCAFSPDGTLLAASGRDGTVRLWQVPDGRAHCALRVAGSLGRTRLAPRRHHCLRNRRSRRIPSRLLPIDLAPPSRTIGEN